ncbi:secretion system protein [Legionella bononiensis]|uniref:Secretion system protein n=1 Tax=Legionella bononiensis TaxID=2793102 RepID=A0ABS1WEK0_9GAMM|nr:secretion system protein [Legionella bononiensis]MBL7479309.1 secretion system protein [Legionella bononiensis]MBL7479371.1 secretion system protein [Legionella bononiensis]MBL7527787.1 secretion system protein [Legionella bononiensis]MBL7563532.1 secretion system protein [Legionella bononiensis]
MPKNSLKQFIVNFSKSDKKLKNVKLTLKSSKEIDSFLDLLQTPKHKGLLLISDLDLSGTRFNPVQLQTLVSALNALPNVQKLKLNDCNITDKDSQLLIKLEHITHLSLNNNVLKRPVFNSKLVSLHLDYNNALDTHYVLHTLHLRAAELKHLSLKDCSVTDSDMMFFGKESSKLKKLTYLNLRKNNITHIGIDDLQQCLALVTLDVSQNTGIGNEGIEKLRVFKDLRTLYADGCGISLDGLKSIARMNLYKVDLSFNPGLKLDWDFGDIKPNHTIRTLNLAQCRLNDGHAKVLIKQFPAATTLSVANNSLTKAGVITLLENPIMCELDVRTMALFSKPVSGYRKALTSPRALTSPQDINAPQVPNSPRNELLQQQLRDKRKNTLRDAKSRMVDLLEAIRTAPALKSIRLENTGLTEKMMLTLIPQEKQGSRSIQKINQLPLPKLQAQLNKQIEAKKEAKEEAKREELKLAQAKLQPSIAPADEPPVSNALVNTGVSISSSEDRVVNPEHKLKELELENQKLKTELKRAQARIAELEKHAPVERKKEKTVVPSLAIPVMFQQSDSAKPSSNSTHVVPALNLGN